MAVGCTEGGRVSLRYRGSGEGGCKIPRLSKLKRLAKRWSSSNESSAVRLRPLSELVGVAVEARARAGAGAVAVSRSRSMTSALVVFIPHHHRLCLDLR